MNPPKSDRTLAMIHAAMCSRDISDKYSDVTIVVKDSAEELGEKLAGQDTTFKCHRWALAAFFKYFDVFFSRWEDDGKTPVTLQGVSSTGFQLIVDFIYTGKIEISASSICLLLHACDYLEVKNDLIEKECVRVLNQLVEKTEPLKDALMMLKLSDSLKNEALINLLIPHVLKYLDHFLRDPEFNEMSFDCMHALVQCKNDTPKENEIFILHAINHWIDHSRVTRKEYREALMADIKEFLQQIIYCW